MADENVNININANTNGAEENVGGLRKELRALGETSKVSGEALGGMGGALGGVAEGGRIAYAAMELMNGGLKSLATTILTNPIFLLATVIAGVVVAMIDLNKESEKATEDFEKATVAANKYSNELQGLTDSADDAADKVQVALGNMSQSTADMLKVQRKEKEERLKNTKEYEAALKKLEDAQRETDKVAQEKHLKVLTEEQKSQMKEIAELKKRHADELLEIEKKSDSETDLIFINKNKKEEKEANEKDKKLKEEAKKRKEKSDKDYKDYLKREADKAKAAEQALKEYSDLLTKYNKGDTITVTNEYEKRKIEVQNSYDSDKQGLIDLLNEKKIDESDYIEFLSKLDSKRKVDIDKINSDEVKANAIKLDEKELKELEKRQKSIVDTGLNSQAKIDILDKETALKIDLINQSSDSEELKIQEVKDVYKAAEEEKTKIKDDESKKRREIERALTESLQNLSDLYFIIQDSNLKKGSAAQLAAAKQQFKINKSLSLASAMITGVEGTMQAFKDGSKVSYYYGIALAAAAAIAAAANIAKISSTQFNPGTTGTSGSSPSTPSMPTSTSNVGGSGGGNQGSNFQAPTFFGLGQGGSGGQGSNPPQKVYVVETDITRTQNRVATIETRATQRL